MFSGEYRNSSLSKQTERKRMQTLSTYSKSAVNKSRAAPYVELLEQPEKCLRFRYKSEGNHGANIYGENSKAGKKTFVTIQVKNVPPFTPAFVVVSCVTESNQIHPHELFRKDGCNKGILILNINSNDMKLELRGIGIRSVKRNEVEKALAKRAKILDPFKKCFNHHGEIDLKAVKLCFQVYLEGCGENGSNYPLSPIVSNTIHDVKTMNDLSITKLSHCSASCSGGQEMILLCKKVQKHDIKIRFFEENGDWEAYGDFKPNDVHMQCAISFKTPPYKAMDISSPVRVKVQLKRENGDISEALDFEMLPIIYDSIPFPMLSSQRKRMRLNNHASDKTLPISEFEDEVGLLSSGIPTDVNLPDYLMPQPLPPFAHAFESIFAYGGDETNLLTGNE